MRQPAPNENPICWIVEPAKPVFQDKDTPYMTLRQVIADKRRKAGDTVTPFYSQRPVEGA